MLIKVKRIVMASLSFNSKTYIQSANTIINTIGTVVGRIESIVIPNHKTIQLIGLIMVNEDTTAKVTSLLLAK